MLPELRCTFGGRSIVSDIAVFLWNRIPLDAQGEIANVFDAPPDWTIEGLSPGRAKAQALAVVYLGYRAVMTSRLKALPNYFD